MIVCRKMLEFLQDNCPKIFSLNWGGGHGKFYAYEQPQPTPVISAGARFLAIIGWKEGRKHPCGRLPYEPAMNTGRR